MKPSERIEQIKKEELRLHFPNTTRTPYANINAIVQYLDEQYEAQEKARLLFLQEFIKNIKPMD